MARLVTAALFAVSLLAACAASPNRFTGFKGSWLIDGHLKTQPTQGDAPESVAAKPPKLALVLGGGGMRGYAHIGVLQALEDAGIRPDLVVGTSIGAIVGAAYSSGIAPAQLWQKADAAHVLSLADVTLAGPGFVRGDALARWVNGLVGQQAIEQFPIKFAAVATSLDHSMPYVITSGNAGLAARASAAIPGVFLPVRMADEEFVDGGVTSLVPSRAARALGAQVIVAVDIYCHGPKYGATSVLSTWLKVSQTQSCLLADAEMADADVVIAPPVAPAGVSDAAGREQARRLGYEAATAALPALRAALQRHTSSADRAMPAMHALQ